MSDARIIERALREAIRSTDARISRTTSSRNVLRLRRERQEYFAALKCYTGPGFQADIEACAETNS